MRRARVGGGFESMLAKVNDTPAICDQLDLLLQPTYTQVYTRQNKQIQVQVSKRERQEVSIALRLLALLPKERAYTSILLS